MSRVSAFLVLVLVLGFGVTAFGDDFDRIEGEVLAGLPKSKDASAHATLTMGEVDALPSILRDSRSAFLVVKTDEENLARMLVAPALRKPPGSRGTPIPVFVLERFDTFESGNLKVRLARGKDLLLFDGFHVDLDSGQVVPEGQGGDLQFLAGGKEGPRLIAVGTSSMFTLTKAPTSSNGEGRRPTVGRSVVPDDFNGRYRLYANGQWSGTLDLKVAPGGVVSGRFRSDLNGTSYPVDGQVAADVPQKVVFTVKFPRARQDFEGLIWTEGKGAMAGTLTMLDRVYGFFAVREGAKVAPEGEAVGPVAKGTDRPGRKSVALRKGQYLLDGQPKTDMELAEALKRAVAADPGTWVLLQVPDNETFAAVNQAYEVLGSAGVASIRL
ncbi:ExbD/TolR family protein, partial [Singulisphaera rosea]